MGRGDMYGTWRMIERAWIDEMEGEGRVVVSALVICLDGILFMFNVSLEALILVESSALNCESASDSGVWLWWLFEFEWYI
jgi:hypothetical protein